MTEKSQKDIAERIINGALRLLSDGVPRSARVLAQELRQLGVNVDKSQINKILYHEGKPHIAYDRDTYSYYLSGQSSLEAYFVEEETNQTNSNGHIHSTPSDELQITHELEINDLRRIPEYQAEQYIESLRMGIPPIEDLTYFTVGRQSEINDLVSLLDKPSNRIKLLKANYGSGKTHLLRLLHEEALQQNFAVSLLTLDAKSGIRFNKLDEIFGEIARNLRVPNGVSGIGGLFDTLENAETREALSIQKYKFYINKRAPQLQTAVGWWVKNDSPLVRDMIIEWMTNPYHYVTTSRQEELYKRIIQKSYLSSVDKEKLAALRRDGTFKWYDGKDFSRTWTVMAELHNLTQIAGLRGLIILVDEFEDVVSNMTKSQQIRAFYHLFEFYKGGYPGLAVFAITPDFVENCRRILLQKSIMDFNIRNFERLPFLEISPLTEKDLYDFSNKLISLYEHAYQWRFPDKEVILQKLERECKAASRYAIPDRPRYIAKLTTQILDDYLE